MAMLPAEMEYVPDEFLHQFEGLLDLGLNQRSEVNYSHVHLHTYTQQEEFNQQRLSTDPKTRVQRVFTLECREEKVARRSRWMCGERLADKW